MLVTIYNLLWLRKEISHDTYSIYFNEIFCVCFVVTVAMYICNAANLSAMSYFSSGPNLSWTTSLQLCNWPTDGALGSEFQTILCSVLKWRSVTNMKSIINSIPAKVLHQEAHRLAGKDCISKGSLAHFMLCLLYNKNLLLFYLIANKLHTMHITQYRYLSSSDLIHTGSETCASVARIISYLHI